MFCERSEAELISRVPRREINPYMISNRRSGKEFFMDKDKTYYLYNSSFSALVKRGMLVSVKRTGDTLDTEYVEEKQGFGALFLAYRREGSEEVAEFCANEAEDFSDAPPACEGERLVYRASGSDKALCAKLAWSLEGACLHYSFEVKNLTEETVLLEDIGVRFCCNTDFGWGKDASPNVIGHHYVGGHGSHSAWYRVDGSGYALLFSPENETQLTFYDNFPWYDKEAHKLPEGEHPARGCTMLYPQARLRGERAEEKGAKLRISQKETRLDPGESVTCSFRFFWAASMEDMGSALVKNGLVHAISAPGYTVPVDLPVTLCLESEANDLSLSSDEGCTIRKINEIGANRSLFRLVFSRLGEHTVRASWDGENRYAEFYYFVTEDIETLWKKRAAFIADKQEKDPEKWYRGLFCEWNNETGVRLSPDNYDRIGGWRIYEVSCDDPGLSKPAFLSSKQVIFPEQSEVTALDDYIEYFVWGGLQQTEEEPYPYGIYGIPDWKKLRDSDDPGVKGKLHIWRIYDYSHIALTYYNMYRVAADYPQIKTRLEASEYLKRAYGTACAMFTIPVELDDWNAVKTGLYNERVIPHIVEALRENGKQFEANKLETFWMRKVNFFVTECKDVFGSEYPFDTTGFESTFYLAQDAIKAASFEKNDSPWAREIPYGKAVAFMEKQHRCNLACRGWLEPAYFWYGSDYRGNNTHYLLSYMSQMGGCSILEHALYYEDEPWEMLRLGYGSLLSSYALMNTGTEESGYGFWFPGKEHDGAAGGGFEPLYETETWLNQPNHGGSWYYSCEIDLGFCGGIRGACGVLADDPVLGMTAYGGILTEENSPVPNDNAGFEEEKIFAFSSRDGAGRRFHYLSGKKRFHASLIGAVLAKETSVTVSKSGRKITIFLEPQATGASRRLKIETRYMGEWTARAGETALKADGKGEIILPEGENIIEILFQAHQF